MFFFLVSTALFVQRVQSHSVPNSALLSSFLAISFTQTSLKALPFCITILLFLSTLAMSSCAFFGDRNNIEILPLIGFSEIFATEKFIVNFELFSLNMEKFLRRAVQREIVSSRKK